MKVKKKEVKEFLKILREEAVKTVFQPIVSLETGEIISYEALSRITLEDSNLNPETLFDLADKMGQLWNLERLCRGKALQAASGKPEAVKIFLNVDGNVILDDEFVCGFTKEYLNKYGLKTEDIVFELTERTFVDNRDVFRQAVNHYKQQGFEIAIDDAGAGYSNLNRISFVEPHYIKIDMELIRNIHLSKAKRSIVGSMEKFCKEMNYTIIAEGIETEEELRCLIELGVTYGQGYYFSKPAEGFLPVSEEKKNKILELQKRKEKLWGEMELSQCVKRICKDAVTLEPEQRVMEAYHLFEENKNLLEICIVDKKNQFHGIVMREDMMQRVE